MLEQVGNGNPVFPKQASGFGHEAVRAGRPYPRHTSGSGNWRASARQPKRSEGHLQASRRKRGPVAASASAHADAAGQGLSHLREAQDETRIGHKPLRGQEPGHHQIAPQRTSVQSTRPEGWTQGASAPLVRPRNGEKLLTQWTSNPPGEGEKPRFTCLVRPVEARPTIPCPKALRSNETWRRRARRFRRPSGDAAGPSGHDAATGAGACTRRSRSGAEHENHLMALIGVALPSLRRLRQKPWKTPEADSDALARQVG